MPIRSAARRLCAALLCAAAPAAAQTAPASPSAPGADTAGRAPAAGAASPAPADRFPLPPRRTNKPPLHGRHWMAITGKPLARERRRADLRPGGQRRRRRLRHARRGATMWDVLSWGGETQALIYNPKTREVLGHQRARRRAPPARRRRSIGARDALPARVRARSPPSRRARRAGS
jgi:hypothetical protein